LKSTPVASTADTCCTIAPRTAVDASPSVFFALSTLRTPALGATSLRATKRSSTRRPVWPVAPATKTVVAPAPTATLGAARPAAPDATPAPRARRLMGFNADDATRARSTSFMLLVMAVESTALLTVLLSGL
jgi:hypothetical protein